MSNSAVSKVPTSSADQPADLLMAVFTNPDAGPNGDMVGNELMLAESVTLTAGIEPGQALVTLSMNGFGAGAYDETAFSVAFKKLGAGRHKLRSRCNVYMQTNGGAAAALMSGTVVKVDHSANDIAIFTIFDDRFLLSKVTVTGQAQYDPINKLYGFVHNAACVFNENGYPNCIDMPKGSGTIPVFAPTIRYGWKSTDYDEPKVGQAKTRARSWRVEDALSYLRMMHYNEPGAIGVSSRPDFQVPIQGYQIETGLIWPSGIEEIFNGAAGGTSRVLRSTKLEGHTLDAALTKVAQRAGPYELLPSPSPAQSDGTPSITSQLSFVDMRGVKASAQAIVPALYGGLSIGDAMSEGGTIQAGHWTESIMNYHDGANIIGDAPVYESVFSTYSGDSIGGGYLEPAWSTEDEAAFQTYITNNGKSQLAFQQACQQYPLVYCAWRVKSTYMTIFKSNAKFGNTKAARAHPRIRPTLITSYNADSTGTNPANNVPREIEVEYSIAGAHSWSAGGIYDNLKVSQDGSYFTLENLRDNNQTWFNTGSILNNIYDPTTNNMKANDIRCTLAIELDIRLVESVGTGTDSDMENIVKARIQTPSSQPFYFTYIGDDGDYSDWNRYKSRPIGQLMPSTYSSVPFPDRCSTGVGQNLFTDQPDPGNSAAGEGGRMFEHTQARCSDVRRIEGGAEFIFRKFSLGFLPGNGVKSVEGSEIQFRGVVTSVTFNRQEQSMKVSIGVSSPSDITRGS